ncbi:ankyrin repeat domain-containing protein [Fusarium mundagurra]|uniref:Ankyrin repeat domain-containing protein n=1 Tax=Fusarium mundagurra TaxID=1567541 RepID=A0A8H6DA51_9HYPO|nr:ankyrin repeat domain-containing protein [Fusarium mundagurra]
MVCTPSRVSFMRDRVLGLIVNKEILQTFLSLLDSKEVDTKAKDVLAKLHNSSDRGQPSWKEAVSIALKVQGRDDASKYFYVSRRNGFLIAARFVWDPEPGAELKPDDKCWAYSWMAYHGKLDVMKALEMSVEDFTDVKYNPVTMAAGSGQIDTLKHLHSVGFDLWSCAYWGPTVPYSPLAAAIEHGHKSVVKYLCDDDKIQRLTEDQVIHACSTAADNGRVYVLRQIEKQHPKWTNDWYCNGTAPYRLYPNRIDWYIFGPGKPSNDSERVALLQHFIQKKWYDIHAVDQNGNSVLHLAAAEGSVDLFEISWNAGANSIKEQPNDSGQSPLELAGNDESCIATWLSKNELFLYNKRKDTFSKDGLKQILKIVNALWVSENMDEKLADIWVHHYSFTAMNAYIDKASKVLKVISPYETLTDIFLEALELNGWFMGTSESKEMEFREVAKKSRDMARFLFAFGIGFDQAPVPLIFSRLYADWAEIKLYLQSQEGEMLKAGNEAARGGLLNLIYLLTLVRISWSSQTGILDGYRCRDNYGDDASTTQGHTAMQWFDLKPLLYLADTKSYRPVALTWAAVSGCEIAAEKALKAYRQGCPHHGPACQCAFGVSLIRALGIASTCEHVDIIRALLKNGVDVNARHRGFPSALEIAAKNGNLDIIELLLEANADINHTKIRCPSALQLASFHGHRNIVRQLLSYGADIHVQTQQFPPALQGAASKGHNEIVELLLDNGADIDAHDQQYPTALQSAAADCNKELVEFLLHKGARIDVQGGVLPLPINIASANGSRRLLKLFLNSNMNAQVQDETLARAILVAAFHGRRRMVEFLIQNGANLNRQVQLSGTFLLPSGEMLITALQAAAGGGHKSVVKLLIESGADIGASPHRSPSPLQAAVTGGHKDTVQLLLDNGAAVNDHNQYCPTAIQRAVLNGDRRTVELLLCRGADANLQGGQLAPPLYIAVAMGNRGIVQLLLDHESYVDTQCGRYGTALMLMSSLRLRDVVKVHKNDLTVMPNLRCSDP